MLLVSNPAKATGARYFRRKLPVAPIKSRWGGGLCRADAPSFSPRRPSTCTKMP